MSSVGELSLAADILLGVSRCDCRSGDDFLFVGISFTGIER